jgi:IclR family transcriptional regulator, pca regulon regulatory protein
MPDSNKSGPERGEDLSSLGQAEPERSLRFSSSLAAGLSLLSCFSAERPSLSIAKLADQLNMTRSTTHRYASTLVALGYLEQDFSRQYRLAPRVADVGLAMLGSMALRQQAEEHLKALRERTGRTVSMVILDGVHIRYVERLRGWRRGQNEVGKDLGLGSRLPAHCTATGKLLLAYLPEAEREALIAKMALTKFGPNCITEPRVLVAQCKRARASGLAVADEELTPGLRSIAAAILDTRETAVAAVGISVPTAVLSRKRLVETMGPELTVVSRRIAATIAAEGLA